MCVFLERFMKFGASFAASCVVVCAALFTTSCSEDSSAVEPENPMSEGVYDSGSSGAGSSPSSVKDSTSGERSSSSGAVSSSSVEEKCKVAEWVGNSALTINEIMPGNIFWKDDLGKDPGWIEIYNSSSKPVALDGYSLVEKLSKPRKWIFGSDTVPAGGYRIVFASKRDISTPLVGEDSDSLHYRTHTNWKLNDEGGSLFLIDSECGVRDSANYPELVSGVSFGKTAEGWRYFAEPTPEADNANSQGSTGFTAVPVFGESGGFYADSVVLSVPAGAEGETVRCTFDGSEPTDSTEEMSAAKVLKSNTVVRCAAFRSGLITDKIITNTYFIDEKVLMPVVAISVDSAFFKKHYVQTSASSPSSADPNNTGLFADVEFPVHVEYFAEGSASTEKAWEIDAGISLMGNYSRLEKKKSVAIKMKEEYQDGWLKYPLFETRKNSNSKFKAFNLRNNGNRFVSDYIEDAMGGAILEGSGVDYQRSRQVVVFYNGNYWGIHDMRERLNKNYVETNYGIDASTVNMVKHLNRTVTASSGTTDDYEALMAFVVNADLSGESNAAYETVKEILDVGNFADYMAAEIYSHNGDWPNNNVRAWKSPEQKWKFAVYDLDHGYDWTWVVNGFDQETNMFDWILQGGTTSGKCHSNSSEKCFHNLFAKLIRNPDFKRLFINRSAYMLENYLNADKVTATVDAMVETLPSEEMERDLEKFKQSDRWYSNSCSGRFSKSGSCLKTWAAARDESVRKEYREEFSLGGNVKISIAASGNGFVQMEGRTLSKNFTGTFFGGNPIELLAVASGSAKFAGWEDGSVENPRFVTPADGASFTAIFE